MKKCEVCAKPLSDFETRFHAEAQSPAAIAGKCFCCCGAQETFGGADVENGGHKKQIAACIVSIVLILLSLIPMIPYLNSYDLPPAIAVYSVFFFLIYIALGAGAAYIIVSRILARRREDVVRIDPPEQRYGTRYTPVKTYVEAREQFDGSFRFEKITRGGDVQVDRWRWITTGSARTDGILGAYGKIVEIIFYLMVYAFLGASFFFWGVPYLVYAIVKDRITAEKRAKIPANLQKAYKIALSASEKMPLTYHDKVGFLVSHEECKKAPASVSPKADRFLSNFAEQQAAPAKRIPFLFTRHDKTAYMIVDYKEGRDVGVSFVLVKKENAPIEKRIVVGKEFADTDPASWQADWAALGASAKATGDIAWYEEKMTALLKSTKKETLG